MYQIVWKLKEGIFKKYNDCRIFFEGILDNMNFFSALTLLNSQQKKGERGKNRPPCTQQQNSCGTFRTFGGTGPERVIPRLHSLFFCKLTPVARLACPGRESDLTRHFRPKCKLSLPPLLSPPSLSGNWLPCTGVRSAKKVVGSISLSPAQFCRISRREKVGFRDDFLSFFLGGGLNGASSSRERKRKEEPQRGHPSKKRRRFFKQKKFPPHFPLFCYISFLKKRKER